MSNYDITVYVSHPLTNNQERNVKKASEFALHLLEQGFSVIVPHTMFERLERSFGYKFWMQRCLNLLGLCDCIVMFGDWKKSKGCLEEHKYANRNYMNIFDGNEKGWLLELKECYDLQER